MISLEYLLLSVIVVLGGAAGLSEVAAIQNRIATDTVAQIRKVSNVPESSARNCSCVNCQCQANGGCQCHSSMIVP